jgi:SAM-dependent methyltransferase
MEKALIEKNSFGFYSVVNKPTQSELEAYYKNKYYQGGLASYELSYSKEEIDYFFNKIEEKTFVASKFLSLDSNSSVIDIGCGEGWVLSYFKKRGIPAIGLDYSSFGCKKFNPECYENFREGDIYNNIDTLIGDDKTFDLVWIDNVLEHVLDPLALLVMAGKILKPGGVMMVEVPNDYSLLQNYLYKENFIDREYWVAYPDHLSYFNKEGLTNLAKAAGLSSVFTMGDFPIDINLLNPNTNYYQDKSKGKSCYHAKVRFENLLHTVPLEAVTNFYKSMMDVGVGRCLISFFVKA